MAHLQFIWKLLAFPNMFCAPHLARIYASWDEDINVIPNQRWCGRGLSPMPCCYACGTTFLGFSRIPYGQWYPANSPQGFEIMNQVRDACPGGDPKPCYPGM